MPLIRCIREIYRCIYFLTNRKTYVARKASIDTYTESPVYKLADNGIIADANASPKYVSSYVHYTICVPVLTRIVPGVLIPAVLPGRDCVILMNGHNHRWLIKLCVLTKQKLRKKLYSHLIKYYNIFKEN